MRIDRQERAIWLSDIEANHLRAGGSKLSMIVNGLWQDVKTEIGERVELRFTNEGKHKVIVSQSVANDLYELRSIKRKVRENKGTKEYTLIIDDDTAKYAELL